MLIRMMMSFFGDEAHTLHHHISIPIFITICICTSIYVTLFELKNVKNIHVYKYVYLFVYVCIWLRVYINR